MRDFLVSSAITVIVGSLFMYAACSGPVQTVDDLACSPKADAEFAASLATECKGKPLSQCPEADAIGTEYERKAEEECSQ